MITQDSKIKINGKTYTIENFMNKFGIADMEQAIYSAQVLVKQGKATVVYKSNADEDMLTKALERENKNSIVDAIDAEEEQYKSAQREAKKEDVDLVNIKLEFATTHEAINAEKWINDLGIDDTEVSTRKGIVSVKVYDITPDEYNKIARKYQTEKAINKVVNTTSNAFNNLTDAVNYGATKVVAPVAKIAGEAGMNISKGLVHTGIKIGAGLVNSGSKAIKETKVALETDPEMLRASRELREAKDTMTSFFRKKLGDKKKSGISTF